MERIEELVERNANASAEDHATFVRAIAELGLDTAAPSREAFASQLAPYAFFLETPAHEVAAYALCRGFGTRGDVRQIVVMPEFRRRGVGTRILAAVAARLRRAGCSDWRLEVRSDNAAAIELYRSVGMEVRRPLMVLRLEGLGVQAPWRLRPLDAADDAAHEDAFDLGRGFLAAQRARRPGHAMQALPERAGLVRWLPDYTPECGLLFPFRTRDAAKVPELLAAAAGAGAVELMATDSGVAEAVLSLGGQVHDRLLEMGGVLPRAP